MTESKVPCTTCGVSILKETAANNGGLCMPCAGKSGRRKKKVDLDDVGEGMGCVFRLVMGVVFGVIIGGGAYAPISNSYPGIAVFAAIGGFVVGFIIGFFSLEIRSFFRMFFD